jgi:hypothetical protein
MLKRRKSRVFTDSDRKTWHKYKSHDVVAWVAPASGSLLRCEGRLLYREVSDADLYYSGVQGEWTVQGQLTFPGDPTLRKITHVRKTCRVCRALKELEKREKK